MTAGGDWGEIIDKEEAERFVGREQELETFRQQISRTPPRYLIFYITGQGGVGKTTLLNRYREIARDFSFLLADCDELQRDIPAVLGRFAHQLAELGYSLKRFNERYKTYRQKIDEIESDPEAPQGLAALVGRTVVRATYIVGDMVPGLRKGLDYFPREAVETQASEWATYLAKKLTNKDEVALVREPTPILTSLFFEDLNEIAKKPHVLLCFENFEETRQELQDWFLRLREYQPSQDIRIAIAGRDQPGAKWDPLRSVTMIVRLDVFTEQEAEAFLDTYKITDSGRRTEILEFSDRLPVLMNWLAAPEGQEPDPSVPTHDIVGRFLRWVTEPAWRQVALVAALPRSFNVDILKLLLEYREQTVDERSSFAWLLTMPFVKQHADGWHYHDVVRRMMLHYQRQESPQTYRKTHRALAGFYNSRRDELGLTENEQWTNEQWRADTLAYAYHFLVADPIKHWGEVLSLFVVMVRKRRAFAIEMMELLSLGDVRDELAHEQNEMVQLFRQQLQAVEDGELKDGFAMFDRLCDMTDLIPQANGYALAYRGESYRQDEKWEKALHDFEEALHYIPEDTWAIAHRGETYRLMGRYQDALADFDRAIALDEKDAWAIADRGETYRLMERYQDALADFDRAITLDEKLTWAIASRGQTYRLMKRYREALADFDRAITVDEKYSWAIANRGQTYRLMKRYQEALADFDRAITLDEKLAWAIVNRGRMYQLMGCYQEALADFDRVIALDEKEAWAIANRGQTYQLMGCYQDALADLDRAIALDEKDAWAIADRGQTYRLMERYQEALADFDRAITLDEKLAWAIADRGEVYRLMKRYQEALADFDRAIALDEKASWYRYRRAQVYMLIGQIKAFESDIRAAIELGQAILHSTPDDCQSGFNLALYYLAAGNVTETESKYTHFATACSSLAQLQDAVDDLTDFLTIQPSNELAQRTRTQLQTCVAALQQSPTE